ncbi:MAG: Smr/MutS family protein [Novosphingobium sp.]|nr:Smr/MutS family protein [Novosphingobium sp.]
MKRPGRKLSAEEAALWARVAKTVAPLAGKAPFRPPADSGEESDRRDAGVERQAPAVTPPQKRAKPAALPHRPAAAPLPRAREERGSLDRHGLDAGWERRLTRGLAPPDFTLDLHGATLDAAHARLDHGLTLALAQGARLVLLITGRDRPGSDRGARGVIRRKFMDWLAAGPHASRIAAIRPAHPRHGGAGAVYILFKRLR